MRVIELEVDNVKGIRTARLRPEGDVIIISGSNGSGKSSLLDSMALAIAGGKASKLVKQPIRNGQSTAEVRVDLGEIVVTRTWTQNGTVLDVRTKEGVAVASQQDFLNKLSGSMWFDPLAFAGMKEAEQRKMLLDLIELPFDPEELEAQKKQIYEDRTIANREAKAIKARLDATEQPEVGLPDEEISTATVMAEFAEAQRVVTENAQKRDRAERAADDLAAIQAEVKELAHKLEQAQAAEQDMAEGWALARDAAEGLKDPDLTGFEEQLATVEETNVKIRAKQAHLNTLADYQIAEQAHSDLDNQLKVITESEREAIADADMPIEGLAFDENGVTFKGLPFKDLSSAEQLKVSVAMGMALNPTLRVMRIMDGSLLDDESVEVIRSMAADQEYQVWLEMCGDHSDVGFLIQDGEIVSKPPTVVQEW